MARYRRAKSKVASTSFFAAIIVLICVGAVTTLFPNIINTSNVLLGVIPYIVGVIIFIGIALSVYIKYQENRRIHALEIADIDRMTGVEFEQYVGKILESQEYKIKFTPASGDYGTDIVATKDKKVYAVQIKRYSTKISPPAIQQAVASMTVYKATHSMVVTNSYFTKESKELAKYNNCELVDRDALAEWILKFHNR